MYTMEEDGEITEVEEGECVPCLYGSMGIDRVDCNGTRPHRDHMLFLARMIPRMCLPFDHPMYEQTHTQAYELLCSSTTVYDPSIINQSVLNEPCFMVEGLRGSKVRDLFPEFPNSAEVRPSAMYTVFCYIGSFRE
tara:strand:- start:562 stop:969 length:408 start_codon:yes stop_codon:yes gene_type:complete